MLNNPIAQFEAWYSKRHKYGLNEPDACTLSTCINNKPSSRVVMLKHYDDAGFVFVTNYRSPKAKEIAAHSYVTLLFYWDASGRQIKIQGYTKKASSDDSDAYFRCRPFISRLASWASDQSRPMFFKYSLIVKMIGLFVSCKNVQKRPSHWGAYIVVPERIEFFEHNKFRINQRTVYEKANGVLQKKYLYP